MGKYNPNEKGSKRDSDVKPQSEKDQYKTGFADKDRTKEQRGQPSERQDERKPTSQYNPRSTGKSQPDDSDTRKPAGDDEKRTPGSRRS